LLIFVCIHVGTKNKFEEKKQNTFYCNTIRIQNTSTRTSYINQTNSVFFSFYSSLLCVKPLPKLCKQASDCSSLFPVFSFFSFPTSTN
jgi:hypothetical protein